MLASIGGYGGPSFCLALRPDGLLEYRNQNHWQSDDPASLLDCFIQPEPAQWAEFLARLEEIGVWRWKACYEPEIGLIMDGTSWQFELTLGERTLITSGHNAYPPKRQFSRFRRAVRCLAGGLAFY